MTDHCVVKKEIFKGGTGQNTFEKSSTCSNSLGSFVLLSIDSVQVESMYLGEQSLAVFEGATDLFATHWIDVGLIWGKHMCDAKSWRFVNLKLQVMLQVMSFALGLLW